MHVYMYVCIYVYYTQNEVIYSCYYKMMQNLTENYLQYTIILGVKPSLQHHKYTLVCVVIIQLSEKRKKNFSLAWVE